MGETSRKGEPGLWLAQEHCEARLRWQRPSQPGSVQGPSLGARLAGAYCSRLSSTARGVAISGQPLSPYSPLAGCPWRWRDCWHCEGPCHLSRGSQPSTVPSAWASAGLATGGTEAGCGGLCTCAPSQPSLAAWHSPLSPALAAWTALGNCGDCGRPCHLRTASQPATAWLSGPRRGWPAPPPRGARPAQGGPPSPRGVGPVRPNGWGGRGRS